MRLDKNVQIWLDHTSTLVFNSLHKDKTNFGLMISLEILIFFKNMKILVYK